MKPAPAPRGLAGTTQDEIRRHNLSSLLRHLHVTGSASRAELTAITGLNRSTIGGLATELAEAGLVREEAPVSRGATGRPSIEVLPETDRVCVLAFDLGVDHLTASRVGLGGRVLDRRESGQRRGSHELADVLAKTRRMGRALLEATPSDAVVIGAGVAVCGVVRRDDGLVRFAPNLGWVDVPLGELVRNLFGLDIPVVVGNDADLGALAEYTRGVAQGSRDLIYLSGEVGVGGGIVVGGRPLEGSGGYAGEVGHMSVNPKGKRCRCGARGCWETEVGEDALLLPTGHLSGDRAAVSLVIRDAVNGDKKAAAALRSVSTWLGLGLGNLVNMFNPEVVVLGGRLREVFAADSERVRAALDSMALRAPGEQVRLELPALGADSTLIGAAELAFVPLLDDPLGLLARFAA